jgi:putative PIN family toxin of toxin-antitoxin system
VRAVLDTNVVASALLWGGTPERLIEAAGEGALELFTSEALLAELAGILGRAKFAAKLRRKNLSAAEIVARYRELAETVEVAPVEEAALRDPDDAAVLACAPRARRSPPHGCARANKTARRRRSPRRSPGARRPPTP